MARDPRSPLVTYFTHHQDFPYRRKNKVPATVAGLAVMAGVHLTQGAQHQHLDYWGRVVHRWPGLRAWLAGDTAFTAPDKWPRRLLDVWQAAFGETTPPTPFQFAVDFLPTTKDARRRSYCYRVEGVGELAALVHGWPLLAFELNKAAKALAEMLKLPQFYIWAKNLDLETVPLPHAPWGPGWRRSSLDLLYKLECRGQLQADPLAIGSTRLAWALPDHWRGEYLERLPQLPQWTSRSSRIPLVLDPHAPPR